MENDVIFWRKSAESRGRRFVIALVKECASRFGLGRGIKAGKTVVGEKEWAEGERKRGEGRRGEKWKKMEARWREGESGARTKSGRRVGGGRARQGGKLSGMGWL